MLIGAAGVRWALVGSRSRLVSTSRDEKMENSASAEDTMALQLFGADTTTALRRRRSDRLGEVVI